MIRRHLRGHIGCGLQQLFGHRALRHSVGISSPIPQEQMPVKLPFQRKMGHFSLGHGFQHKGVHPAVQHIVQQISRRKGCGIGSPHLHRLTVSLQGIGPGTMV